MSRDDHGTTVRTVDFQPLGRRARVRDGSTLLDAARLAGVGLNAVCGGAGTCGTCRVRVVAGEVTPPAESEYGLEAEGLRLACETRVLGDIRVDVPPSSITAPQRAQVEGRELPVEVDPPARAYEVAMDPPALDDLRSDSRRLRDGLLRRHGVVAERVLLGAVGQLATVARSSEWRVQTVVRGNTVLAVLPPTRPPLGLAVDLGTTKLAGYLVDLSSGETLAATGTMNPQIAYGEDVMARISHAMTRAGGLQELQRVLVTGLDGLIGELAARAGRPREEIVEAVLVGNTCMHHLALGLPVASLGTAPYVPALTEPCDLDAAALGLELAPAAAVHLLPNIAGFVGADHVAMVLAARLHGATGITLGFDIGTNAEIVLATGDRLLSCSCASGPAFEGAHIRDGMRAAPGAIDRVRLTASPGADPVLDYQTIDGAPAVGICGSGVLDALAAMLAAGILQPSGAMSEGSHPRVRTTTEGPELVLARAGERGALRDVVVTRRDVNEIQLAKAAIRAGARVLLDSAGLAEDDVERVVVAGAFGTYLDVGSAIAIGMFPPLPHSRFEQVGNAAGMGAKLCLLSQRHRDLAADIAAAISYVELAGDRRFTDAYTSALMFPSSKEERDE